MPGINLYVAVPAGVSWAVASKWESVQLTAVASQNWTCPVNTPTVAVRVTTVPDATRVTVVPLLMMASVVVVAVACAEAVSGVQTATTAASKPYNDWKSFDWIERFILGILCGSRS